MNIEFLKKNSHCNFSVCICLPQGVVCVCQVSVCVRTTGLVIAVVVLSPRQPANQPTACCAAGGADVCVASVCATTPGAPETSVRDVPVAKAPANHPGTCRFVFATTKHDGSFY